MTLAVLNNSFPENAVENSADGEWLVSVPLTQPLALMTRPAGWAERGPLLGFVHGLLFEREAYTSLPDGHETDADLILRLYEQGDEQALTRLRGSFVLAVIDRRSGKAIVLRDALGLHPLFYGETGGKLVFSDSPKSLIRQTGISRELNRAALADYLCQRWPDPQETYFSKVRRVPPGHRAVISGGRVNVQRWWHPAPDGTVDWLDREALSQFDEFLERAITRCLGHGRTGIFLSGGLDSVSIAAIATDIARRTGKNPLLALSLGYTDPDCDERALQTSIAQQLNLPHRLLDFGEALGRRSPLELSLQLNEWLPGPVISPWLPAYMSLARLARNEGVETIITGEGGDEWLGVTPLLAADLIRRGAWSEVVQLFRMMLRSHALSWPALTRNVFWKFGLRPVAGAIWERVSPGWHRASRVRRTLASDPAFVAPDPQLRAQQALRAGQNLPPADPKHGFYLRELDTSLDHPIVALAAEERYTWAKQTGVRLLHPYLDADLVGLLYRIPPQLLTENGRSKSPVRGMLARRFPVLGFERQRKVSAIPFIRSLIAAQGPALLDFCGDFPALSRLGVIDGRTANRLLRRVISRGGRPLHDLLHFANLEIWAQSQDR